MNRNKEFFELKGELEQTPPRLDYTVERARSRRDAEKKRSIKRAVWAPIGSFAAVFAVFVLMVNLLPGFAYAAGRIPLIRELAKAVAASPSLSAAVENEYVQPIELEQTENGITVRIEYAIVDQKQLNLFYSLRGENGENLSADIELLDHRGSMSYGADFSDEELQKLTADYMDGDVPDTLSLRIKVFDRQAHIEKNSDVYAEINGDRISHIQPEEPDYITELDFTVTLDPYFTSQGEHLELGTAFELDGQRLTLETAEIYPTHMRFRFSADEENTAWLMALEFYVENEKGERFEGISNGLIASGSLDSPMMETFMLESAFFAESKHLTMHITGAAWLDKDREQVTIDLKNATADFLPEGVELERAEKKENGWVLIFSAPMKTPTGGSYSLFGWDYTDPESGRQWEIDGYSSTTCDDSVGSSERFSQTLELYEYTGDTVVMYPAFTRRSVLNEDVSVNIK